MKKEKRTLERQLYIAGLIALAVSAVFAVVFFYCFLPHLTVPCIFFWITGLYCPGCGGTRAVKALLQGKILLSLWYHPLVLYALILYMVFMGSHTLELFIHGFKGVKFHSWYVYAALGIVIINCIVKNILLLCFGITI
ncbi:MAG: DUF2752 domain-containing protein [Lachnospiraceae bacterium]|nr:DUF2752 domain-containing protein [Lachnospiraceae bacterium]